ncbi:MAG: DNA-binding MarR family transcriptional regulator [Candidatus Woesearchaeota archaeon]|jgi:DNA-binding MarR family transcriptional regulator
MWHKKLGFKQYPLDPRSNPNLVGVEDIEKKLITYIEQGNMCLLAGFTGSGKTSMLKRVSQSSKLSDFRFVFISADGVKKDFVVSDAIKTARSFVEMLTFQKPRNLIVQLDESHLANRILTESIKSKWNETYADGAKVIQSVVVSQIEPQLGTNFSGSFIDRLGHRIIQMKRLNQNELKEVLKHRLHNGRANYLNRFDDAGAKLLIRNADGSVRQLLEYTDAVFRSLCEMDENPFDSKDFVITKEIVFNMLQQSGLAVNEKSMLAEKGKYEKLLSSKRYMGAIEMFEQFGTLGPVLLAEKLDTSKSNAQSIITELIKEDAVIQSHISDDQKFYVLTPRIKHMLVKQ